MMKAVKRLMQIAVFAPLSVLCVVPLIGQQTPVPPGQQGGAGGRGPGMAETPLDPSIKRDYVRLGSAYGLLYRPVAPGEKSHIGIFVMHSGADYTSFSACTELSKRGYTVFCVRNGGGNLNRILLDAKASVEYLRKVPGIQKVILFGHSGGATLMTAYQDIAENGVKICQDSEKISKCPDNLAGMPAADGVVLADSNWGNAVMTLFSIDPAVMSEDTGNKINPDLDLFNPKNGYNPKGSDYSQEFIKKFQSAVAKRNNDLIHYAQSRLAAIDAGQGRYADDEPLVIPGGNQLAPNNKLFAEDIKLMSHTRQPWPLIHADGSVTTEVVHSVRTPEGHAMTSMLGAGALNTTVKNYLVDSAIRVDSNFGFDDDSVQGVEWKSTYSDPPGNVEDIHVPMLVMGMTGHYEYLASETIYEKAASKDKSLAFVEGASHMYNTCKQCEKTPGQFGDTVQTLYNYVDTWISKPGRFTAERRQ